MGKYGAAFIVYILITFRYPTRNYFTYYMCPKIFPPATLVYFPAESP